MKDNQKQNNFLNELERSHIENRQDAYKRAMYLFEVTSKISQLHPLLINNAMQQGAALAQRYRMPPLRGRRCDRCMAAWGADDVRVRIVEPLTGSRVQKQYAAAMSRRESGVPLTSRERWLLTRARPDSVRKVSVCQHCGHVKRELLSSVLLPTVTSSQAATSTQSSSATASSTKRRKKKSKKRLSEARESDAEQLSLNSDVQPEAASLLTTSKTEATPGTQIADHLSITPASTVVTSFSSTTPFSRPLSVACTPSAGLTKKQRRKRQSQPLQSMLEEQQRREAGRGSLLDRFLSF